MAKADLSMEVSVKYARFTYFGWWLGRWFIGVIRSTTLESLPEEGE